jgi:hypothetical protein
MCLRSLGRFQLHRDDAVTVDEVLTLVNIALGSESLDNCRPGDMNGDQRVTVEEILFAVDTTMHGC